LPLLMMQSGRGREHPSRVTIKPCDSSYTSGCVGDDVTGVAPTLVSGMGTAGATSSVGFYGRPWPTCREPTGVGTEGSRCGSSHDANDRWERSGAAVSSRHRTR
jgi:hypothetical protein